RTSSRVSGRRRSARGRPALSSSNKDGGSEVTVSPPSSWTRSRGGIPHAVRIPVSILVPGARGRHAHRLYSPRPIRRTGHGAEAGQADRGDRGQGETVVEHRQQCGEHRGKQESRVGQGVVDPGDSGEVIG